MENTEYCIKITHSQYWLEIQTCGENYKDVMVYLNDQQSNGFQKLLYDYRHSPLPHGVLKCHFEDFNKEEIFIARNMLKNWSLLPYTLKMECYAISRTPAFIQARNDGKNPRPNRYGSFDTDDYQRLS
jgi:hypothetical protein